ncbi:transposase, MuDR [Tanacetum coccineum]
MYVGGKLNYVDKIGMDLFNVDELHMFVKDLGYDPKQLMFYHYKLPNKSLDYGLRPLSCDADVVSLIKLVANCKKVEVFVEYWLTSVDHQFLSPVKSSKTLALCWINEADVGESSVDKNANVHEEQQTVSVNDYLIDDRYELDVDENLNLEDYTVYVHENVDENMNVNADDENVNADDENVNADDEYDSAKDEQDHVDDENGRGFSFSVQEQGVDQTVTPNVDLTDEALEVLDFNSFDNDVGDDIESIRRRKLRKLRKTGGQSCGIVNTLFVGQEFANKELAKAKVKAHAVETRRKIRIVKNDSERLQAKSLKYLFPAAGHRYCIRHIHDNMNLIYKGGQYKEILWKYATATTEVHFERVMDEFNGYIVAMTCDLQAPSSITKIKGSNFFYVLRGELLGF